MKHFFTLMLLAAAAFLLIGPVAQANIVVGGYFHLGEADPGAVAGNPGNDPTMDSSGLGLNLTKVGGNETYSSIVAASAATATGSSLAMTFDGTGYYNQTSPLTVNTDNFGIEGWFKVNDLSQQSLALNGSSWINGYGLYLINGRIYGLYGGLQAFDTGIAPTPGEWFYAALVRDAGDTKMYVNNATAIDFGTATAVPNIPTDFKIGVAGGIDAWGNWAYQDYLKGAADEVRVFAFGSQFGYAFNAGTDLLISQQVPEPSTLVLLAAGLAGISAVIWRKRK
jgi:hypothetical protein